MNAKKLACAPEDIDIHELWSKIDWDKCERFVQKLQARIVKAQREGRHNKVKAPAMDAYPLVLRQSIGGKTSYD